MKRREFLKATAGAAAAASSVYSIIPKQKLFGQASTPDLVVFKDGEPEALVRKAVEELGGMSRFVSKGDVVVLKPNISWDRVPAQAATTNPDVVAEVVRLCLDAGAKKVKIFDRTLNEPRRCYKRSGIEAAGKEAGADVTHIYDPKFQNVRFPDGELIKMWPVYKDVLDADRIINIPIAKHHSIGGVSLGMKNYMGWLGDNRGKWHRDFDTKIVDLSTFIKADLTILDAYRMLLRNGPSGGNLADVEERKTVVAGTDPVAMDSYGVSLFGQNPMEKPFLVQAAERGLGQIDLDQLSIKTVSLA